MGIQKLIFHSILSPLLGKAKQKPFVIRFAAEALSFLVRKSKGEHLRAFILYVLSDFEASHNSKQYGQGLSSLFIESCVVGMTLHLLQLATYILPEHSPYRSLKRCSACKDIM